MSEIAVIGAGAWGTGLAIVLGRKGTHRVRLWAHETDVCESINQRHVNDHFFAGTPNPRFRHRQQRSCRRARRRTNRRQRHAVATLPRPLRTHALDIPPEP